MEKMQHLARGSQVQTRMLIDVSVRGIIRIKNEDEVKELIERMSQNE